MNIDGRFVQNSSDYKKHHMVNSELIKGRFFTPVIDQHMTGPTIAISKPNKGQFTKVNGDVRRASTD